ncbi:MAG: response regulator transcription factor [Lachnospiraceae bacterium]|nr:response regulator transcription factor [Lachnospiraceae bacterium]
MIKIAFCDDDPHSLEMIRQRTEDFFRGVSEDASFFEFSSPENLVYEMEDGSLYDLLILDVVMPRMNGLAVAAKIRRFLPNALLIFISDYPHYVFDVFQFKTFRFIPKSQLSTRLPETLADVLEYFKSLEQDYLVLPGKRSFERIPYEEIVVIVQQGKYSDIRKSDGTHSFARMSLAALFLDLPKSSFVKISRSEVCHLGHIDKIESGLLYLDNGEVIPVSHGKVQKITEALLQYWKGKSLHL